MRTARELMAMTPITAARRKTVLERTLRDAVSRGLPDGVAEVIGRVVARARLWPGEGADVAQELIAHFEDGVDAGLPVDTLLDQFGDAETTATLIGRAKRRQRPAAWHALRYSAMAVGALITVAVSLYGVSAASLYLHAPAHDRHVAPTTIEQSVARSQQAWSPTSPTTERRVAYANALLEDMEQSAGEGDANAAGTSLASLVALSDSLRRERTVAGDMLAGQIDAAAADALREAVQNGGVDAADLPPAAVDDWLTRAVRLHGVRASFRVLLDEMYTGDADDRGHLTGDGVEVLRRLKQWHQPTTTDRFMEPVWYAFPASRQAVVARFERLCDLAEQADRRRPGVRTVTEALDPIRTSMMECLRFPAISAVYAPLAGALVANERAGLARREALRALEAARGDDVTGL